MKLGSVTGKKNCEKNVRISMHRAYSIPYVKVQCWLTRSNSKNEENLKSKKSLISSDTEMEMNFVSTKWLGPLHPVHNFNPDAY